LYSENVPVISIGDLREIIKEQNLTSERKEKIDSIVKDGVWDFDDIFQDHNYCQTQNSMVFECVIYFLAG